MSSVVYNYCTTRSQTRNTSPII